MAYAFVRHFHSQIVRLHPQASVLMNGLFDITTYNAHVPKKKPSGTKKHPGRGGHKISLYPLTPDQATAALLRVKLADVKKLEAEEALRKGKKK